jgi:hypothetical protein
MNVEELFTKLSYGELSNLDVAVEGTGTIRTEKHPAMIHHANEALKRLYSRFLLSEKTEQVTMVDGTTEYTLAAEDVLRVLAIYSAYGHTIRFETTQQPLAVTVRGRTLLIPIIDKDGPVHPDSQIEVVYQAKHPVLTYTNDPAADLAQEIVVPDCLEEALTAYVASQVYKNMNTPEALTATAGHYSRFEQVCAEVERERLVSSGAVTANTKFSDRGWM